MVEGFHHIALRTIDFDRSIDFYTKALSLKLKATWTSGGNRAAMLDLGDGGVIEMFEGGRDNKTESPEIAGEWFHLALKCEDPDAAFNAAIDWGATAKLAPQDIVIRSAPPIFARIAFVYGPCGEVIEFFCEKRHNNHD